MRSLLLGSSLALCLWGATAHAQELPEIPDVALPCAPDVAAPRSASVVLEGRSGFWFEGQVARCMLGRLAALGPALGRVRLIEERLQLSNTRDVALRRLVSLAEQEASVATDALSGALRAQREAEEAIDAWYRHPIFLVGVGAALVVVLEIAAIVIFRQVTP